MRDEPTPEQIAKWQPRERPILMVAHPRSCSTAFERLFLGQTGTITCVHEPFCDAYHFGPERLSERFEDEMVRSESGYSNSTYLTVMGNIAGAEVKGTRLFIKDMAKSLMPPKGNPTPTLIPPSLQQFRSRAELVLPNQLLDKFHFTFLIRHPSLSIPSLYQISTPPGSDTTGWHGFHTDDCGYLELRTLFDHLRGVGQIGPGIARGGTAPDSCERDDDSSQTTQRKSGHDAVEICVIDAEDLLSDPQKYCRAYCRSVGLDFQSSMLFWAEADAKMKAEAAFQKSWALHVNALKSVTLEAPARISHRTREEEDDEWTKRFGEAGARVIRKHVDENLGHYMYLKQFAM